jgi:hypothetical protein
MKKLLALVLALVMTLGLATVSSNAAYSDEADVSLNEAVDVMSAVGVFQGADGKFSPKENLTREQAAKLIAYLDLGESAAEALPGVKVFSDVEATRWSAKYIAYCQDAGYIAGVGNGKFNPTGELTGYAFGKMILCVLGYDAGIEGFTGNAWSINVAKLMEKNDIAKGVSGAASATLTREQAAQYCLNALKATMVEYDTKGTSIEINGAKIATGASKAEDVYSSASYNKAIKTGNADNDGKYTLQLGEKLYKGDLKVEGEGKADDFGAPSTKWTYKTSSVGTYNDTPDATYTGKVTKGTIYTLLTKDVVDDLNDGNAKMYVKVDGADKDVGDNKNGKNYVVKNSSAAAFDTDKGMITEVYIDDDGTQVKNDKDVVVAEYASIVVVVKNTYLMQANADYNSKTEKLSVTDLSNKAKESSLKADDFAVEDFKEDDYILYTYANKKIQTIEKASTVSGKVETYKAEDSVTLDGTKYSYSANFATVNENAKNTTYEIGDTATVVLDSQGNVIAIDETNTSNDDVVFVMNADKSGFDYVAKVVTVEGKKMTVTLDGDSIAKTGGDKLSTMKGQDADKAFSGKFFAYEVDGNEYKLTPYDKQETVAATKVKDSDPATYEIKLNRVTTLAGKIANSSTVYIVNDGDDITLYTGVKNAPKTVTVAGEKSTASVVYKNSDAIYVYVDCTDVESADSSNDQMIYILKKAGTTPIVDSNKKEYVEAKALVDGVETTLKIKAGSDAAGAVAGKLYKNMTVDANGYITKLTLASDAKYKAIEFNNEDVFAYSDGSFAADLTDKEGDTISGYVKTDSVHLVLFKPAEKKTNELMDDADADYEIVDLSTFKALGTYTDGFTVEGSGYIVFNGTEQDSDIVDAYIGINTSVEKK